MAQKEEKVNVTPEATTETENKTATVTFRLTPTQKTDLIKRAKKEYGLTVQDYVEFKLLNVDDRNNDLQDENKAFAELIEEQKEEIKLLNEQLELVKTSPINLLDEKLNEQEPVDFISDKNISEELLSWLKTDDIRERIQGEGEFTGKQFSDAKLLKGCLLWVKYSKTTSWANRIGFSFYDFMRGFLLNEFAPEITVIEE